MGRDQLPGHLQNDGPGADPDHPPGYSEHHRHYRCCGMGSNLYLAKVAMDIVSKHIRADRHGVRIAKLTEESYRRLLWAHRP